MHALIVTRSLLISFASAFSLQSLSHSELLITSTHAMINYIATGAWLVSVKTF
jgi:hypothetical protein